MSHIWTLALRIQLELLHFWDGEALSRRKNQQIETKQHSTDDVSQQNSIPHDNSRISQESTILAAECEEVRNTRKTIIRIIFKFYNL